MSVKFRLAFGVGLACSGSTTRFSRPLAFLPLSLRCASALRFLALLRLLAAPLLLWLHAPDPPSIHGSAPADSLYHATLPATHHHVCLGHKAHLPPVYAFGLSQQPRYLSRQSLFRFTQSGVAHALVLRGIGFDLRTIDGHVSQLDQPSALAQLQHLHKQAPQFRRCRLRNSAMLA